VTLEIVAKSERLILELAEYDTHESKKILGFLPAKTTRKTLAKFLAGYSPAPAENSEISEKTKVEKTPEKKSALTLNSAFTAWKWLIPEPEIDSDFKFPAMVSTGHRNAIDPKW
jgi:hypothetical protein